ncbi:diguanylate cyclase [Anaerocolumna sp. AGMB13025]|uniref:GGDEF domain-containing protein n=1 Tax=Anaerocolumna sp. AGMB13025 TaxID=3039116 RepID=UPI00241CBAAD|nr:diguanylate cyclase [Anaerocolumna sp. AGMB13025]WFR55076.1 diguanylate cyclase [Anaerocolumna sp. AGMB13025]
MANKITDKKITGYVLEDLGMLLLLICLFSGTVILSLSPVQQKMEFTLMLLVTFMAVMLAAYRLIIPSIVCAGFQVVVYTAYKIFMNYTFTETIEPINYIWLIYPLITVGAMILFIQRSIKIETEIGILREQVEDLVLIDSLTGLYNLKSLYLDLGSSIALATRKKTEITLMIVRLRYEPELKKILGRNYYNTLKQKLAVVVQETLRVEDKVYAIDDKGTLAMILLCDAGGAKIVKDRLKHNLNSKDAALEIIENKTIRLDFQFAYLQYQAEVYGKDVIGYKQKVESELQYDV